jgi:hypothetical protein
MNARWITDPAAWRAALAGFDQADVYHDPDYAAATAEAPELLVVEGANGRLALPLALHPLPAWCGSGYDAETPYGYAAPLVHGAAPALWRAAGEALAARGIVSAFLRLHPFVDTALPADAWRAPPHPTAWIPLADGLDAAFAGARCATHRSQVHRAGRAGLVATVQPAPTAEDLEGFRVLYDATMARLHAAAQYRFGPASYRRLAALGPRLALVAVRDADGALAAAALGLSGPRWAHYHLSARAERAHNAAGDLLLHALAGWAAERGCAGVHLGGGTSTAPDDPLLAFKRHAGRQDAAAGFAGLIADPLRHRALLAAWQAQSGREPRRFQAYREEHA